MASPSIRYFVLMIAASMAVAARGSAQATPVVTPPDPAVLVNVLSGARAFIGPDEARFVFPRQINDSYEWDVPIPGVSGGAVYWWEVGWEVPADRKGIDPVTLSLVQWWKSGGPRRGSLTQLIEWLRLRPLIEGPPPPRRRVEDRRRDYRNVFATVENGQLVFIVRGAEAIRRIFPTIPSKVYFSAYITQTPQRNYGASSFRDHRVVIVNCRNPDEPPADKYGCDW